MLVIIKYFGEKSMKENIKDLYINFFVSKGHKQIPSSSVVPENDPTCLFNTAGMQPLVPYLLGAKHPLGTRLCDFQKCFRLTDLDEVGDNYHHTFFEMLGNWSLGDYFKKDAIAWSFEFLTKVLNLPLDRLAFTVFAGNEQVPADEESASLWQSHGVSRDRIAFLPAEDNWWPSIEQFGPCGSDTEMFYWIDNNEPAPKVFDPSDKRWMEIWNNVFMQFNHLESGEFVQLSQKNVDTGMGVERTTAVLAGLDDNYLTPIWQPIIHEIEILSGKNYQDYKKPMRVIADHMRAIVMIAGDDAGIKPSNTDQGYILRRLIRRVIRFAKQIGIDTNAPFEEKIIDIIVDQFKNYYPEVLKNCDIVKTVVREEKNKFNKTLENGLREFDKIIAGFDRKQEFMRKTDPNFVVERVITGKSAFNLYETYGFPIEMTEEIAKERGIKVDTSNFKQLFKEHQEKSKQGSEQKFKGGLSDASEENARLHTATHLMQAGLQKYVSSDIRQKGSNITPERLRFDFNCDHKLLPEELKQVEDFVNDAIAKAIPVTVEEMTVAEAKASGALGVFDNRYGEKVTVYTIGNLSKEICGGPHAKNTQDLHHFKIIKEEASSAGIRRIKAILD